jgi:transcriptional regulator with XRE-family HTH domain
MESILDLFLVKARSMEKSIHTREYAAVTRLLRQARENAGLTQTDLAKALGQSQSFVCKAENGDRRLDVVQLRTVLATLGVTLIEFARRLEREIASPDPAAG